MCSRMRQLTVGGCVVLLLTVLPVGVAATESSFTYQGQLKEGTAPVTDTCDFQFKLWNAVTGGQQQGMTETASGVEVHNGLFSAQLDFGVAVFNGEARWLQVLVRCSAGSNFYTTLAPREPITAAPYSVHTRGIHVDGAGNVGIGTLAPGARLEVADTRASARLTSSGSTGSLLDLRNTNKDPSSLGTIAFGHLSATIAKIEYTWSGMDFGAARSTWMRLTPQGKVGIGTLTPAAKLEVKTTGQTSVRGISNWIGVFGAHEGSGTFPGVWGETNSTSSGASAIRGFATAGSGASYGVFGRSSSINGVGVYATNNADGTAIRAVGNGAGRDRATLRVENTQPNSGMAAYIKSQGSWATMHVENNSTGEVLWLQRDNSDGPFIVAHNADTGRHVFSVSEHGYTKVAVMEITGGADLSEGFDVSSIQNSPDQGKDAAPITPQPGMVVSIDPDRPGKLMIASEPYDSTVAGIISGAGGVQSGMRMGHSGTLADGDHPVALSGRVYCLCDASSGAIRPGDLLTTSSRPGHAMKVTDRSRAGGAVIGKAMTALEKDTGLVLVLVSLQ